jgi:hypothetical protein
VVHPPEIVRPLGDLGVILQRIDDQRPPQRCFRTLHLVAARSLAQRLLEELRERSDTTGTEVGPVRTRISGFTVIDPRR